MGKIDVLMRAEKTNNKVFAEFNKMAGFTSGFFTPMGAIFTVIAAYRFFEPDLPDTLEISENLTLGFRIAYGTLGVATFAATAKIAAMGWKSAPLCFSLGASTTVALAGTLYYAQTNQVASSPSAQVTQDTIEILEPDEVAALSEAPLPEMGQNGIVYLPAENSNPAPSAGL